MLKAQKEKNVSLEICKNIISNYGDGHDTLNPLQVCWAALCSRELFE